MKCKSLPRLHVKQYVRYPRGWLQTTAVSQELVCIFHHDCLISWLCAWRPTLHLTFLKVWQAAHVQQTRGNEVRGKVFTLVCVRVCTYSRRACVALFFFPRKHSLFNGNLVISMTLSLSVVLHQAWSSIAGTHPKQIPTCFRGGYESIFFCTSFNLEEQLEAWYTAIEHVPGETLGNDDIFKRCIDAGRG